MRPWAWKCCSHSVHVKNENVEVWIQPIGWSQQKIEPSFYLASSILCLSTKRATHHPTFLLIGWYQDVLEEILPDKLPCHEQEKYKGLRRCKKENRNVSSHKHSLNSHTTGNYSFRRKSDIKCNHRGNMWRPALKKKSVEAYLLERGERYYDKVLLKPSNVLCFYVDNSVDVCVDHWDCTSNERAHTLKWLTVLPSVLDWLNSLSESRCEL